MASSQPEAFGKDEECPSKLLTVQSSSSTYAKTAEVVLLTCRMKILFMTWSCATECDGVYTTLLKPVHVRLMCITGWSLASAA